MGSTEGSGLHLGHYTAPAAHLAGWGWGECGLLSLQAILVAQGVGGGGQLGPDVTRRVNDLGMKYIQDKVWASFLPLTFIGGFGWAL